MPSCRPHTSWAWHLHCTQRVLLLPSQMQSCLQPGLNHRSPTWRTDRRKGNKLSADLLALLFRSPTCSPGRHSCHPKAPGLVAKLWHSLTRSVTPLFVCSLVQQTVSICFVPGVRDSVMSWMDEVPALTELTVQRGQSTCKQIDHVIQHTLHPKTIIRAPRESFVPLTQTIGARHKSLEMLLRRASRKKQHFNRASKEVRVANRHSAWEAEQRGRAEKKVKLREQSADEESSVGQPGMRHRAGRAQGTPGGRGLGWTSVSPQASGEGQAKEEREKFQG